MAGALVAQGHRERALAGDLVGRDVAEVVGDQESAGDGADGDCAGGKAWESGLSGAISGAKIAATIHRKTRTMPVTASGWRHSLRIQPRRLRVRSRRASSVT